MNKPATLLEFPFYSLSAFEANFRSSDKDLISVWKPSWVTQILFSSGNEPCSTSKRKIHEGAFYLFCQCCQKSDS